MGRLKKDSFYVKPIARKKLLEAKNSLTNSDGYSNNGNCLPAFRLGIDNKNLILDKIIFQGFAG